MFSVQNLERYSMIQKKLSENLDGTMCVFYTSSYKHRLYKIGFLFLLKTFTSVKPCYLGKHIGDQIDSVGQKG